MDLSLDAIKIQRVSELSPEDQKIIRFEAEQSLNSIKQSLNELNTISHNTNIDQRRLFLEQSQQRYEDLLNCSPNELIYAEVNPNLSSDLHNIMEKIVEKQIATQPQDKLFLMIIESALNLAKYNKEYEIETPSHFMLTQREHLALKETLSLITQDIKKRSGPVLMSMRLSPESKPKSVSENSGNTPKFK